MNVATYIDHTLLKQDATSQQVQQLCKEAADWNCASACIPPYFVVAAARLLEGTGVRTCTVIGFPFGYSVISAKVAEAEQAIADGAIELDLVINLAALKSNDWMHLDQEIKAITAITKDAGVTLKVIVESGILTDDELRQCCDLYGSYPIDFMKTSTGYAASGASVYSVQKMRQWLPAHIAIKASGGIRTFAFAQELINAGAIRIGCSATGAIIQKAEAAGDL